MEERRVTTVIWLVIVLEWAWDRSVCYHDGRVCRLEDCVGSEAYLPAQN